MLLEPYREFVSVFRSTPNTQSQLWLITDSLFGSLVPFWLIWLRSTARTTHCTPRTQRHVPLLTNVSTLTWELCTNALLVSINLSLWLESFELTNLFISDYYYPQLFAKAPADPEKFKKIEEAFEFFNIFLENSKFVAGNHLTIADISLLATVSSYEAASFDLNKYANVARWYNSVKNSAPGHEINQAGIEAFKKFFS